MHCSFWSYGRFFIFSENSCTDNSSYISLHRWNLLTCTCDLTFRPILSCFVVLLLFYDKELFEKSVSQHILYCMSTVIVVQLQCYAQIIIAGYFTIYENVLSKHKSVKMCWYKNMHNSRCLFVLLYSFIFFLSSYLNHNIFTDTQKLSRNERGIVHELIHLSLHLDTFEMIKVVIKIHQ